MLLWTRRWKRVGHCQSVHTMSSRLDPFVYDVSALSRGQMSKILAIIILVRTMRRVFVKACLNTRVTVMWVSQATDVRMSYRVRLTKDRSDEKRIGWIGCTDDNVHCPTGECLETNNPLTPVYCQCYDGTRRDPRQNGTCPLSRSIFLSLSDE